MCSTHQMYTCGWVQDAHIMLEESGATVFRNARETFMQWQLVCTHVISSTRSYVLRWVCLRFFSVLRPKPEWHPKPLGESAATTADSALQRSGGGPASLLCCFAACPSDQGSFVSPRIYTLPRHIQLSVRRVRAGRLFEHRLCGRALSLHVALGDGLPFRGRPGLALRGRPSLALRGRLPTLAGRTCPR
jgi:hypothetical protein